MSHEKGVQHFNLTPLQHFDLNSRRVFIACIVTSRSQSH